MCTCDFMKTLDYFGTMSESVCAFWVCLDYLEHLMCVCVCFFFGDCICSHHSHNLFQPSKSIYVTRSSNNELRYIFIVPFLGITLRKTARLLIYIYIYLSAFVCVHSHDCKYFRSAHHRNIFNEKNLMVKVYQDLCAGLRMEREKKQHRYRKRNTSKIAVRLCEYVHISSYSSTLFFF